MERRLRWLLVATATLIVGRLVHDLEEFGRPSGDWVVTGLLIPAGLATWWAKDKPRRRAAAGIILGWSLLHLVVGALLSVLPLPIWPFEPAQTVSHYLAHAAYGVGAVPGVVWGAMNVTRKRPTATDP